MIESLAEVNGRIIGRAHQTRNRRIVTLSAFLADMIGDHIGRYPSPASYLSTAPEGGPVRHHYFRVRNFRPAAEAAGMPDGLRFHDLRHTCAATLIGQGWSPKQIADRLGHASIRTALDNYSHLFEGHHADLLDRLDARARRVKVRYPGDKLIQVPGRHFGEG